MIVRILAPTALLALCCAGSAQAAPASTDAPQAEVAVAVRSGAQVICRMETPPGTIFGKRRVCLTRDQWDTQRRQYREEVERAQTRKYSR